MIGEALKGGNVKLFVEATRRFKVLGHIGACGGAAIDCGRVTESMLAGRKKRSTEDSNDEFVAETATICCQLTQETTKLVQQMAPPHVLDFIEEQINKVETVCGKLVDSELYLNFITKIMNAPAVTDSIEAVDLYQKEIDKLNEKAKKLKFGDAFEAFTSFYEVMEKEIGEAEIGDAVWIKQDGMGFLSIENVILKENASTYVTAFKNPFPRCVLEGVIHNGTSTEKYTNKPILKVSQVPKMNNTLAITDWMDENSAYLLKFDCSHEELSPWYQSFSKTKKNHIYTISSSDFQSLSRYIYQGIAVYMMNENSTCPEKVQIKGYWNDQTKNSFFSLNDVTLKEGVIVTMDKVLNEKQYILKTYCVKKEGQCNATIPVQRYQSIKRSEHIKTYEDDYYVAG